MKPLHSVVHLLHLALFLLATQLQLQPCVLVALSSPSSIAAGESLNPPNFITSPSGDFAFGFRAVLDSSNTSSNSFLLAIWFHFDPSKVMWFAADAGSAAVDADQSSFLWIAITGQLSLANPGNDNLWSPYTDATQNYGSLLVLRDTGNLQFLGFDGKTVVWESFKHPTDTLLPGQLMSTGTSLRSRASHTDFSAGRFMFIVPWDGNLVLYRTDLPGYGKGPTTAYWSTSTCCFENGNATLFFDAKLVGYLYFFLLTNNGTTERLKDRKRRPEGE